MPKFMQVANPRELVERLSRVINGIIEILELRQEVVTCPIKNSRPGKIGFRQISEVKFFFSIYYFFVLVELL